MDLPYAVILIVLVALAFDFLNGMNDAADSIAAVVATQAFAFCPRERDVTGGCADTPSHGQTRRAASVPSPATPFVG